MTELTAKTIAELRDGFRAGAFSAREIAEEFNAAVATAKALNAFTVETPGDVSGCFGRTRGVSGDARGQHAGNSGLLDHLAIVTAMQAVQEIAD